MDTCTSFDSCLGNHTKCTSNCMVRKRNICRVQQRIGPEYAGPFGILQALADETKLLFKENLIPFSEDIRLFSIGPSLSVISILISYSVIPFGYNFVLSDFNIGVFFMDCYSEY